MRTPRAVGTAAAATIGLLLLAGCAQPGPGEPTTPAPVPTSQTPAPPEPSSPSPTPTADAWERFEVGDGHTSWSMPQGWSADIATEVTPGTPDETARRGLVRDADGTPMLRFEAVQTGQYASDFAPCERPETEVLVQTPLDEQVSEPSAAVVTLAYERGDRVVFAAGVSELDPDEACEPGILAIYQEDQASGYAYLVLEIVDDAGEAQPTFADFAAARAYLHSEQYATIAEVLASLEVR